MTIWRRLVPRGRPAIPTALKLLRGNPGKRRINRAEPQPPPDKPTPPRWLNKEARQCWEHVAKALEAMDMLRGADQATLIGLCVNRAIFVRASRELEKYEQIDSSARLMALTVSQAVRDHTRACTEFGLGPSSRAKLQLPQVSVQDDLETFAAQREASFR